MESQYGQLPHDTTNISTFYDRAVINYNYNSIKASTTFEQFITPMDRSSYMKISQFSLQIKSVPLEVKLGNFYETLGRGLY